VRKIIFYSTVGLIFGVMVGNAGDPIRLKNFREVYSSYANIMGVDASDSDLQGLYRVIKDRLPKYGLPQEFTNGTVLAMTELSGFFCKKAIAREVEQTYGERLMFSDVDFTRGPNQFSEFLIQRMGNRLGKMFWLRDLKDTEVAALTTIASKATLNGDDPEETKKVLQVLCASFASSMAFLVK
jgi:hypothetical protein